MVRSGAAVVVHVDLTDEAPGWKVNMHIREFSSTVLNKRMPKRRSWALSFKFRVFRHATGREHDLITILNVGYFLLIVKANS